MSTTNILLCSKTADPFSRVPRTLLDDPTISWKAKGILAYLLGKPVGWKVQITDLLKKSTDGEKSVRAGLQELRDKGYSTLEVTRDEKNRIATWNYKVSDHPIFQKTPTNEPDAEKGDLDQKPDAGFLQVEKLHVEKLQVEKGDISKIESSKKDGSKKEQKKERGGYEIPLLLNTPEFRNTWSEWETHRKEIRHPLTPTAARKQLNSLLDWGMDRAIAAINYSIRQGWEGIYEEKPNGNQKTKQIEEVIEVRSL